MLAMNACALFWFARLGQHSRYASVLVSLALFGLGRALFVSPNTSSVMGAVPPEKRGVANGVRMTLNMTDGVLSVPHSLQPMTFVMPYTKLSAIVGSNQLANSASLLPSSRNQPCMPDPGSGDRCGDRPVSPIISGPRGAPGSRPAECSRVVQRCYFAVLTIPFVNGFHFWAIPCELSDDPGSELL